MEVLSTNQAGVGIDYQEIINRLKIGIDTLGPVKKYRPNCQDLARPRQICSEFLKKIQSLKQS
jgi:hypothetical protein